MNSFQEIVRTALDLKVQVDDLRSATYTVVEFVEETNPTCPTFMFIASFDYEALTYHYAVTDANFIEVKTLAQLRPETMAAFGKFIENMLAFEKGGPHPYKDHIFANAPEKIKSPHDVSKSAGPVADTDIDSDEVSLK